MKKLILILSLVLITDRAFSSDVYVMPAEIKTALEKLINKGK